MAGIVDFITEGYLVSRPHKCFDDQKLSATGFSIAGFTYLVFASLMRFHIAGEAHVAYLVYACGKGLFELSISSLVSGSADANGQGKA